MPRVNDPSMLVVLLLQVMGYGVLGLGPWNRGVRDSEGRNVVVLLSILNCDTTLKTV